MPRIVYQNMKEKQVAMAAFFADDMHSLNLTGKWIEDDDIESDTTIRLGKDIEYFTQCVVRGKTAQYTLVRSAPKETLEVDITPGQYRKFHSWASPLPTQGYIPLLFPLIDMP